MKSKLNLKLLFFIAAILFLILAIISIRATYARYVTSLTATSYIDLGRWLIRVNNQNIIQDSDVSGVITPVFEESDYIAEGVIAPTSTGYVEINLDYTDVTVPFRYDISFEHDASTILEDFKLISYSVDGGETIDWDGSLSAITATISPTETTRTRKLKLNFSWYDGSDGELDDTEDTAYAYNVDEMGLRFTMNFTQLTETT